MLCVCVSALSREKSVDRFNDYIAAVYWVITTMTSTGYGDVPIDTIGEIVFATFVMIIGKVVFGLILANIAATMANAGAYRVVFEHKIFSMRVRTISRNENNMIFSVVLFCC